MKQEILEQSLAELKLNQDNRNLNRVASFLGRNTLEPLSTQKNKEATFSQMSKHDKEDILKTFYNHKKTLNDNT